jgi:hypothetical protein
MSRFLALADDEAHTIHVITDLNSSTIVVDFWENEKHRALQGWTSISSLGASHFHHYSDLHGLLKVDHHHTMDASFLAGEGWEWTENWHVDRTSCMFGDVDQQGWAYASSFEQLVKDTVDRALHAIPSSNDGFRRRRWVRIKKCVSDEALVTERERRQWMMQFCRSLNELAKFNYRTLENLQDFNFKWSTSIDSVKKAADFILLRVLESLQYLLDKLTSTNVFLKEAASIEAQYAHRLRELSLKWMNSDNGTKSGKRLSLADRFTLHGRVFSDELREGIHDDDDDDDDDDGKLGGINVPNTHEHNGFFETLSNSNFAIAEEKTQFADVLGTFLPEGNYCSCVDFNG